MLGVIALLGLRRVGFAALVMVVLDNSLSGAATSPDLRPTGFGRLGQLLPAGATASPLRSTSGFDGAGATGPVLVLAGLEDPLATRPEVLAAAILHSQLQLIPGDHGGVLREPGFRDAIVAFLAEGGPQSPSRTR